MRPVTPAMENASNVVEWLHGGVLDPRSKSPIEFIRAGEFDRVIEILATFLSGAFI